MTFVKTTSWLVSCSGGWAVLCRSTRMSARLPSRFWKAWWSNTHLMIATQEKWAIQLSHQQQSAKFQSITNPCNNFSFLWYPCRWYQSQQARLATLYLPLFGLLQENINRLDVKESTIHNPVSLTSHGVQSPFSKCLYVRLCIFVCAFLKSKFCFCQNVREESIVVAQKTGSIVENALHKDVCGVIAVTGDLFLCPLI